MPISFEKADSGLITIDASWTAPYDVDLAAMYELADDGFTKPADRKSAVQALGNLFGNLGKPPFIKLNGDSRTGGSECLTINLPRADRLERVLIFAYIYGPGTWQHVRDTRIVVHHPTERTDHVFDLSSTTRQERTAKSLALVDLYTDGNGGLTLMPLGKYFTGTHVEIDNHYSFGINWSYGSK